MVMTNRRNCDGVYKLACIKRCFFYIKMFNMENIFQKKLRSESLWGIKWLHTFYSNKFFFIVRYLQSLSSDECRTYDMIEECVFNILKKTK